MMAIEPLSGRHLALLQHENTGKLLLASILWLACLLSKFQTTNYCIALHTCDV